MMSLVFAWLNFAIYILIGRYAYQRWFKTQLSTAISAKKTKLQNLQNEVSGLENQIKELAVDLVLQEKQAVDLFAKLEKWREVALITQQTEQQEFANLQQMIAKNNQIKMQNLALKLAQKHMLANVVSQTTELLCEQFKQSENANIMMRGIFNKLESR